MAISEQSIYRAANEMIQMNGRDAAQEALTYANELGEKRDEEGRKLWLQVCAAIEELLGR
ncbi:MAG TPA: hypothetical protein VND94_01150 [Terriglobia bacterium]|nr:hypothetical protein [Terriglobia bacterium]